MEMSFSQISKNRELPKFDLHVFKSRKTKYCICIPIINEGEKIKKQLAEMKKIIPLADVIIADGGSTDNSTSPKLLKRFGVRTLLIKKSPGRQATQLRMAFAYALDEGYKGIIQMDGNNKDGINAIPSFIKALDQGYDYIQGSRFIKGGKAINTPFRRSIGIRYFVSPVLSLASKYWYTDVTNGFRAYSRKYLLHLDVKPFRNIFVSYSLNFYLTVRANQLMLKTKEIPVTRKYPKGKIPTKMSGLGSELNLFSEVLKTALGYYYPQD